MQLDRNKLVHVRILNRYPFDLLVNFTSIPPRLVEAAHANSLKSTAIHVFPYVNRFWRHTPDSGDFVRLWMMTISSVPYTDDVGQCVVDTLLQLASEHDIRGYIVKDAWSWLSRRPPLPPACSGLLWGTTREVVQTVRALKDVEIFKSYLLLVWSEWDCVWSSGFDEMCMSIREDFSGIGNGGHCAELMGRLVSILNQFDLGFEYFLRADPRTNRWSFQRRMEQYLELLKVALEVYENVEKNLAGTRPIHAADSLCLYLTRFHRYV